MSHGVRVIAARGHGEAHQASGTAGPCCRGAASTLPETGPFDIPVRLADERYGVVAKGECRSLCHAKGIDLPSAIVGIDAFRPGAQVYFDYA